MKTANVRWYHLSTGLCKARRRYGAKTDAIMEARQPQNVPFIHYKPGDKPVSFKEAGKRQTSPYAF